MHIAGSIYSDDRSFAALQACHRMNERVMPTTVFLRQSASCRFWVTLIESISHRMLITTPHGWRLCQLMRASDDRTFSR